MAWANIERRKRDHLAPFRSEDGSVRGGDSWLSCVHLVHRAAPERALDEVDLSVSFLGHRLRAPIFVTGMTGGTTEAREINRGLARCCEDLGIAFGLGSQRAMLEDPSLVDTYRVRDVAPTVFLAGNLGGVQLAQESPETLERMLRAVGADALCVHLNPAQEMAQPEGDRDFRGILEAIARTTRNLGVPVLAKEVGSGIGRETGQALVHAGVRALDVAGVGGTSWVGVEIRRAGQDQDEDAVSFRDWGIPTAAAILETVDLGVPVVASGGIRTARDALRALALGASLVGLAAPAIQAWFQGGEDAVRRRLQTLMGWIARGMVLVGARTIEELRGVPRVIGSPLREWMADRVPGGLR